MNSQSLDFEKEQELFIGLFNKLFEIFESNKLLELQSLSNEGLLKQMLFEIEPKIEDIAGKIEISVDNSFGMRYSNMVSILNTIENYLDQSSEKSRFISSKIDVKKQININELLKNDKRQLIIISEFLILLMTISSKVNYFLDRLEDADEKYIHAFCAISDKFLVNKDEGLNQSISSYHNKTLFEDGRNSSGQAIKQLTIQNEKLQKKNDELNVEKVTLLKNIQDLEKENSQIREKSLNLERTYNELECKLKDTFREVEILKSTNKSNIKVQEELLQDSIQINDLKSQLKNKDLEIEEVKKDCELQLKAYQEKVSSLSEKMEVYEDKLSAMKSLSNENEKLKLKLKDMSLLRDKLTEYDELVANLESKSRIIDNLIKEKQNYITQLEKANKDIIAERDKYRQVEFERKRIEFELKDLKKENSRMENQIKNRETQLNNYSTLNDIKRNSINNSEIYAGLEKTKQEGKLLYDLDQSSVMYEIDKTKEERIKLLEKENDELRAEKSELVQNYKIQSEDLNEKLNEKEKLVSQLEENQLELKKLTNEKDKLILEKEKLLLKIQKIELDVQRTEINFETDKKKVEEELKECQDKLKKTNNEKENLVKELENLKIEKEKLTMSINSANNINNSGIEGRDNTNSVNMPRGSSNMSNTISINLNDNKKESNPSKDSAKSKHKATTIQSSNVINLSENNVNSKNSSLNLSHQNNTNLTELNDLKSEIQNLKSKLSQKEDLIKSLQLNIKSLENENQNINHAMSDSIEKFNADIIKRSEDLEFYKNSYEEQKNRVNREHELISSSLYELALQFMSLKSELQKKVSGSTVGKNWLDNERSKNFPLDNK